MQTRSGTPGSTGATVTLAVPSDAPNVLYYYCSNHGGMASNANISISDSGIVVFTMEDVLLMIRDKLNVG